MSAILRFISELPGEPQGRPREPGKQTGKLTKILPAPKGKVSRDLESPDPGPGPDPRGLAGLAVQVQVQGRCRAGAGARQVQGRCRCKVGAGQAQMQGRCKAALWWKVKGKAWP